MTQNRGLAKWDMVVVPRLRKDPEKQQKARKGYSDLNSPFASLSSAHAKPSAQKRTLQRCSGQSTTQEEH